MHFFYCAVFQEHKNLSMMSTVTRVSLLLGLILIGDCLSLSHGNVTATGGNLTKAFGDAAKEINITTATEKNTTTNVIDLDECFSSCSCPCVFAAIAYGAGVVGFLFWPLLLGCCVFGRNGFKGKNYTELDDSHSHFFDGETRGFLSRLKSRGAIGFTLGYLICGPFLGALLAMAFYYSCVAICDDLDS